MKTASWFTAVPPDHIKIGISRGTPRGQPAGYRLYKTLAPGPWFNSVSVEEYYRRYRAEILGPLDRERVVHDIRRLAGGRIPVLCCYEKPNGRDWCHRAMAAEWLAVHLKRTVPEFDFLTLPQHEHPLMPAQLRRPPLLPDPADDVGAFVGKSATLLGIRYEVLRADPDNPGQAIVQAGDRQFPCSLASLHRYFGS
jgi:hypothetical protein